MVPLKEERHMAERKQFLTMPPADPELLKLLDDARGQPITEHELREQRISFAFGNALEDDEITKESVREASEHIRLRAHP
jgi:hypothetical protein